MKFTETQLELAIAELLDLQGYNACQALSLIHI